MRHFVEKRRKWTLDLFLVLFLAIGAGGCATAKRAAMSSVADALASGGGAGFGAEDDPEFAAAAAPFSLKLMETLLGELPEHEALLVATSGGFAQYAYAFVQQPAERLEAEDYEEALRQKDRARRFFLRSRDYAMRALEAAHPGFKTHFLQDPDGAVKQLGREDVPAAYWAASAWAGAINLGKDQPDLVAELPYVDALVYRAYALDPDWDHGAIDSFLMAYAVSQNPDADAGAAEARKHFDRAVSLTDGLAAGVYVGYAEATALPSQKKAEFVRLLNLALAVDLEARPAWRLANRIYQRRATWLLEQVDDLILE